MLWFGQIHSKPGVHIELLHNIPVIFLVWVFNGHWAKAIFRVSISPILYRYIQCEREAFKDKSQRANSCLPLPHAATAVLQQPLSKASFWAGLEKRQFSHRQIQSQTLSSSHCYTLTYIIYSQLIDSSTQGTWNDRGHTAACAADWPSIRAEYLQLTRKFNLLLQPHTHISLWSLGPVCYHGLLKAERGVMGVDLFCFCPRQDMQRTFCTASLAALMQRTNLKLIAECHTQLKAPPWKCWCQHFWNLTLTLSCGRQYLWTH